MKIHLKEKNLKIAIKSAIKAGEKLLNNYDKTQNIISRKNKRDVSTKVDFEAEQAILDIISKNKRQTILFEEKLSQTFDLIIFIQSDINKRKERVLKRGVTSEYFKLMDGKQINQNTKYILSDYTIQNNSSILNLRLNIIKLLNIL